MRAVVILILCSIVALSSLQAAEPMMNTRIRELAKVLSDVKKSEAILEAINKRNVFAEDVMLTLGLRSKNGLGIGGRPGQVAPDGIEAMLSRLCRARLDKSELAALRGDLLEAGQLLLAVSRAVAGKCPPGKKDRIKQWNQHIASFTGETLGFIEAIQASDTLRVQKAAVRLDQVCSRCHNEFR